MSDLFLHQLRYVRLGPVCQLSRRGASRGLSGVVLSVHRTVRYFGKAVIHDGAIPGHLSGFLQVGVGCRDKVGWDLVEGIPPNENRSVFSAATHR